MKNSIKFTIFLLIFCLVSLSVSAQEGSVSAQMSENSALSTVTEYVERMITEIHQSSSKLTKIAEALICYSMHGEDSYFNAIHVFDTNIDLPVSLHLISPMFLITGLVSYVLVFFILMASAFYMFDVAFNICITLLILPLGLALWPFGWTRDKLKVMIESIAFYTGVFIFLPLGVLTSIRIIISPSGFETNVDMFYERDNLDALKEAFGFSSHSIFAIWLCYAIALRVIPLMASEFCSHFFGKSLLGNPIHEVTEKAAQYFKSKTIDKVWRYGKNVARHGAGSVIKKIGNNKGGLLSRAIYRYGKNVGKAK